MELIYPPKRLTLEDPAEWMYKIFLAGTIDKGNSEDWQSRYVNLLKHHNVTVFNPRRPDWDNSIKSSIDDVRFVEQVNWEMDYLDKCDLIVLYIAKGSKSPVSLIELGKYSHKDMIVYCAEDFHCRGNVEIVCFRDNIPLFSDEEEFVKCLMTHMETFVK